MRIKRGVIGSIAVAVVIAIVIYSSMRTQRDYHSVQTIRRPCGRILRRTVERHGDTWTKTVELLDTRGMFVIRKVSKVIEPDVCDKIGRGIFVRGLWNDCSVD
jgi:hypothetical protein